jgi:hypothetical protein
VRHGSLGGKILLQLADTGAAGGAGADRLLTRLCRRPGVPAPAAPFPFVIVDSMPGAKAPQDMAAAQDSVSRVLHLVRSAPRPIPSRAWVQQEAARAGVDAATGAWLASNVTRAVGSEEGLTWTFDPAAATDLFHDYLAVDLWRTLHRPPAGATFCVAMATKSSRWKDADVTRQVSGA